MSLYKINVFLSLVLLGCVGSVYISPRVTFVSSVSADLETKSLIIKDLQDFDIRSNNSLIRDGYRPITISVGETEDNVMGYAQVGFFSCEIVLSDKIPWKYMDPIYLRSTVLHEILHCMGFNHTKDVNDIMYTNHSTEINEDSITNALVLLDKRAHF